MRLEKDDEKIRDISPSGIRIPSDLKEKLKASAKQANRSLNAEVVSRLQSSVDDEERWLESAEHEYDPNIEYEKSEYEELISKISSVVADHLVAHKRL